MSYYIGIDIGGTNIACGLVDEKCDIIATEKVKTNPPRPYEKIVRDIIEVTERTIQSSGIDRDEIKWIGIGCPGICNQDSGLVEYSNNLGFVNVPLVKDVRNAFGKQVFIDNDANAAAFGEYIAGSARGSKNAVVITLGTGVGSGIIINGKIYSGSNFAGGELGHTVICVDGYECTCGRHGCFEAYSSATGLIRMTKEQIDKAPSSVLAEIAKADGRVSARTAFNAMKLGDSDGKAVVDRYIKHLAQGIANTINIFQPDILCIGGGVCNEGDNLLVPLKKLVNENVYSKNSKVNTKIEICSLGNNAGIIGAAMLGKNH